MCRRSWLLVAAVLWVGCGDIIYESDEHWTDPRDLPDIGNGKILITNSGDDTLTWLDLDTLAPVFTEPVGRVASEREGPHHGAALPDGSGYLIGISNFVPGSGSGPHGSHGTGTVPGLMLKYDSATHELVGEARVDRSPGDVRITPDGALALQSHFDLLRITEVVDEGGTIEEMYAALAVVDVPTMDVIDKVPVCVAPHGIAVAGDSSSAFVACWGSDELALVGLADPFPVERFAVGPGEPNPVGPRYEPYAVVESPVDGTLWLSCLKTGELRIFDPASRTWDETRGPVAVNATPYFGAFTSDGGALLVAVQQPVNGVVRVDPATGQVADTLPLAPADCRAPHAVFITPDDQQALVVCEGDHLSPGSVAVLTLEPLAMVTSHPVGVFPDDAILLTRP